VTILYRVGLLFSAILSVVTVSCICGLSCDDIVLIEFFIRLFRENLETKTTYMLWRYTHQPPLKSNNGGLHPKYMDGFRAQVPAVCVYPFQHYPLTLLEATDADKLHTLSHGPRSCLSHGLAYMAVIFSHVAR
jgi:hypothetical protein